MQKLHREDVDTRSKIELSVAALYVSIIAFLVLGCLLRPDIFWDGVVWKYFWGPIESDAGLTTESTSDYNWVDTLTYGITLALSAYFIHRLFVKLDLRVGTRFFLALSPVILIGPSARVLEDMELFEQPLEYLFISPIIYIFLGVLTLATILAARAIERSKNDNDRASWLFLMIPGLTVSLFVSAFPEQLQGDISIIPILLITLGAAFVHRRVNSGYGWEGMVGTFWAQIMLFVVYMYVLWGSKGEWYEGYVTENGTPDTALAGGVGVIVLVLLFTLATYFLLKISSKKWSSLGAVLVPVNIMIIGGHMLDASATFVGIDFYGYTEKHVLPEMLMRWLSSTGFPYPGMVMYPLKLAFLIPALYFIDVRMEKGPEETPHLVALVKLAVLVLGFAPGARDIIRLSLGV